MREVGPGEVPKRLDPGGAPEPTNDAPPAEPGPSLTPLPVALARGGGAGVVIAIVLAFLGGVLDVTIGGLAMAAVGGWLIGSGVRGARSAMLLAVALGGTTWLLSIVLEWLVSRAVLPASTQTLVERVVSTPFIDWLAPQFGLLELATLALLVGVGAATTRSPRAGR